jgi:hypothetical protein
MNREDQEFDQLRRLLKLKRHEQPPPRYFNDFSAQVVARITAVQASGAGDSWWQKLWAGFELRPAIPVALSAAVCGLLVFGAVYSETAQVSPGLLGNSTSLADDRESSRIGLSVAGIGFQPTPAEVIASSTNFVPVIDSFFDRVRPPETLPAGHPMFR